MQVTFMPQFNVNNRNQTSFKGYSPEQICSELCKGACCNHNTPFGPTLKRIADKICASYHTLPYNLKTAVLIKAPIVEWAVDSNNVEVQTINKLANTYIDAISRETNPEKIAELTKSLDKLNAKLEELLGDKESFLAITNPIFKDHPEQAIATDLPNICMFKDHGKTNKCTIYHGITLEDGKVVPRPQPCITVGSEELPCPWLNPEKTSETFSKMRAHLARVGYRNIPDEVMQSYVAKQYNLNQTWYEKIYKPYLESQGIKV